MEFINKKITDSIEALNFKNQIIEKNYKDLINIIINNVCDLLFNKNIEYDYKKLLIKIQNLKLICRNGISPEYDDFTNTLYVGLTNQTQTPLTEEEQIIKLIHETIHLLCPRLKEDSISDKYYAFEEFFTEYLTFYIVRRIGGIKLEKYYLEQTCGGYFSKIDNNFIKNLLNEIPFPTLLTVYFSNKASNLEKIIPKSILFSMQSYFVYYEETYDKYNLPLKELNQLLEVTLIQKNQVLNELANEVNKNIELFSLSNNQKKGK